MTAGDVYNHLQRLFSSDVGLHVTGTLHLHVIPVRTGGNDGAGGRKAKTYVWLEAVRSC